MGFLQAEKNKNSLVWNHYITKYNIEFDNNYNLTKVVLPNFCKMIQRQYPPNTIFEYDHTIFDKKRATIIIKVNNQPIRVRIDLSELDK